MSASTANDARSDRRFLLGITSAAFIGAAIRIAYDIRDTRAQLNGDGNAYHIISVRLADGFGYTLPGRLMSPFTSHPPGWVAFLGAFAWLGARSLLAQQLVGAVVGVVLIVLVGVVARRAFGRRVGVIAAALAAVYPGFWVLEGNVLSEPLVLVLIAVFTLVVFGFRDTPTIPRAAACGVLCGLIGLVRSEDVALLLVVVVPVILMVRSADFRRRIVLLGVAGAGCLLMVLPWTAYTASRYHEPVYLSTNAGALLLVGNCPPTTYSGPKLGWWTPNCGLVYSLQHPTVTATTRDHALRKLAVHNVRRNLDKMPVVVPARFGRLFAVFRPSQTVSYVAALMGTGTAPVWAWVVSYWLLVPFAIAGVVRGRRERRFLLPFLAPLLLVAFVVAVGYGEPRYHTPSDLGVVVLAAVGIERIIATASGTRTGGSGRTETARAVRE